MENFDCLVECSNLRNAPGNCVHGRWQQLSVPPTTFGTTPEKVFASSFQPTSSGGAASHPANCGLGVLSSLLGHTKLKNAEVDGFNLGLPSVVSNYKDSLKQTALLRGVIPANACLGNIPSSRVRFESSETHLKRFIMFDHSAGKGRIFLHPALMQELSGHTTIGSTYVERVEQGGVSDMEKPIDKVLKASMPYFGSKLDARLLAYRETVASAFATLQCIRNSRICNLADKNGEHESPAACSASEAESSSRISCARRNDPICGTNNSCWHENTEDINALLCSDDEITSTGHFSDDGLDEASVCDSSYKKRRCSNSSCKVGVGATSAEADSSEVSVVAVASPELTSVPNPWNDLAACEKECHVFKATVAETCSKSVSGDSQNVPNYVSSHSHSTPAIKARRRKIRRTVKTLRKIIPGGDCMDVAVVLDEAIQYVKSLQCKVQQLDASRHEKYTVDMQSNVI